MSLANPLPASQRDVVGPAEDPATGTASSAEPSEIRPSQSRAGPTQAGRTTSGSTPAAQTPPGQPVAGAGMWDALARHLNPANYRPVQSPAVTAVAMKTRHGEPYFILANRALGKYARLSADEFYIWGLMDGSRTVKDLVFEYYKEYKTLAFDVVTDLVGQLRADEMLTDPPRDIYASLERVLVAERPGHAFARIVWQAITGQRTFKIRHIDGLMDALHRHAAWVLYTRPMQVLYVLLCLVGSVLFARHFASGRYDLFRAGGSYGTGLLLLVGLNFLCVVVHEASHALTCKHHGGQVHSAGLMLYFGVPAAFVDTTDIWTKPAAARIATTWAGPYSGWILAGAGAVVVQVVPGSWVAPILHKLSFLWLLTLAFNVIPFLELDGYYMAVDWLEIPLLRARALSFFRTELWDRLRRKQPLTGQERLLAWFGGLSMLFSGLVLLSALWSWNYRFKFLVHALWMGGLGSKVLLVLLLLALGLPLVLQLVGQARAVVRRLTAWAQFAMVPRGRALRERETLLRRVPCLSDLPAEELGQAAAAMPRHLFHPGQIVVRAGEEPDRFYMLQHGVAELWVDGEPRPRRRLRRGDYFGDGALLNREPNAETVRAGSWLSLFSLRRADFDRWVAPHLCAPIDDRLYRMQALRRLPMFATLPARQLDALAARVVREHFDAGATVCQDCDGANAVYLVESGQAAVVGGEAPRRLGAGARFGESALLPLSARPETVRAVTPLDVLKLRTEDFDAVLTSQAGATPDGRDHAPTLRRVCCPMHAGAAGP